MDGNPPRTSAEMTELASSQTSAAPGRPSCSCQHPSAEQSGHQPQSYILVPVLPSYPFTTSQVRSPFKIYFQSGGISLPVGNHVSQSPARQPPENGSQDAPPNPASLPALAHSFPPTPHPQTEPWHSEPHLCSPSKDSRRREPGRSEAPCFYLPSPTSLAHTAFSTQRGPLTNTHETMSR